MRSRSFGAEGIGLCRTEHMFFETDRLPHRPQKMILAKTTRPSSDEALASFAARMQREDFVGLFKAMDGQAGDHPAARPAAARVPCPATTTC